MQEEKRRERKPWLGKLFMGALFWLASKVLEPVPVLGALVDIVAFAF